MPESKLTREEAARLVLTSSYETPTIRERGLVSTALAASRRQFKHVVGFQSGNAYAIMLARRDDGSYDYLQIAADTAELIHVSGDQRTTVFTVPITLTAKEMIKLCELKPVK